VIVIMVGVVDRVLVILIVLTVEMIVVFNNNGFLNNGDTMMVA
jgi:hypothetical protein